MPGAELLLVLNINISKIHIRFKRQKNNAPSALPYIDIPMKIGSDLFDTLKDEY